MLSQCLQKMIVEMDVYDEKSKEKIMAIVAGLPGKSHQIKTVIILFFWVKISYSVYER